LIFHALWIVELFFLLTCLAGQWHSRIENGVLGESRKFQPERVNVVAIIYSNILHVKAWKDEGVVFLGHNKGSYKKLYHLLFTICR